MERWICGNVCLVPRSSPKGKPTVNNYQEKKMRADHSSATEQIHSDSCTVISICSSVYLSQEKDLEVFQRRPTRMIKYKEYFPCEEKVDSLFRLEKK